ncbi:hypothetical protein QAD02_008771 [Eretmocerus hayati]|uniref:Uncharacterized protein n=1 Tax=Eretmocerus hayati TaxID=131215 RepID=A0ACC2N7T9_9HYME|nr:hypothetical protein QAD02_008771 [Eretmocerus hayati]
MSKSFLLSVYKKDDSELIVSQEAEKSENPVAPPPVTVTLQTGVKRPLSSSGASTVSSTDLHPSDEAPFVEVKGKVTKKSKNDTSSSSSSIAEQLEPAHEYINANADSLPMSYDSFLEFLESTQTKSKAEIIELARLKCDNFEILESMLTNTYKFINSRTLRARLTRIKKSLSPTIDNNTFDVNTDTESNAEDVAIDELADHNRFALMVNDGANE